MRCKCYSSDTLGYSCLCTIFIQPSFSKRQTYNYANIWPSQRIFCFPLLLPADYEVMESTGHAKSILPLLPPWKFWGTTQWDVIKVAWLIDSRDHQDILKASDWAVWLVSTPLFRCIGRGSQKSSIYEIGIRTGPCHWPLCLVKGCWQLSFASWTTLLFLCFGLVWFGFFFPYAIASLPWTIFSPGWMFFISFRSFVYIWFVQCLNYDVLVPHTLMDEIYTYTWVENIHAFCFI